MVSWELLAPTLAAADWNVLLLKSRDYSIFQSFDWGEYKRAAGWIPMRWLARDRYGSVVCMAQVLTKSFPGKVKIGWAPGGPVLFFPETRQVELASVVKLLLGKINALGGKTFIRFGSYLPRDENLSSILHQSCSRPRFKINSGYSICFDLQQPLDELTRNMTRNHRRFIRKALAHRIEFRAGRDSLFVRELLGLQAEMIQHKKLPSLSANPDDIFSVCNVLGEQATIFTGYFDGEAVTSALVLSFGQKAIGGMIGATGNIGRQLNAGYALYYRLLQYLQTKDMTQFDFGGINPGSLSARGVDHFKKGFGGSLVEHLGEWEWSNDAWLRWGFNLAVWARGGKL
jgi:lipid II:glycine glycyltransferase (peptidoglycan interpeptide bridge formation enzyme)